MTRTTPLGVDEALAASAASLARLQETDDSAAGIRGEFRMAILGDAERPDFNYLSGYTLLHVGLARGTPGLPADVASTLDGILLAARDVPGRYQSVAGLGNWYSCRGSGLPCPPGFDWPGGRTLLLRDDYDDTAVSAMLSQLAGMRLTTPITAATFDAAALDTGVHRLVPKSWQRIDAAGIADSADGIYRSWALDRAYPGIRNAIWLPDDNSVELTTVANVCTAVTLLGGGDPGPRERSAAFVNGLARYGIEHLIAQDPAKMDFASGYYPRFPFAPLAYLAHNHVLTGGDLLDSRTADLLGAAILRVEPTTHWRVPGFGTRAFWLNCCLWCVRAGIIDECDIRPKVESVWRELRDEFDGAFWPDMHFFYGAHVGHYAGRPYSLALMLETLALLTGWGIG